MFLWGQRNEKKEKVTQTYNISEETENCKCCAVNSHCIIDERLIIKGKYNWKRNFLYNLHLRNHNHTTNYNRFQSHISMYLFLHIVCVSKQ